MSSRNMTPLAPFVAADLVRNAMQQVIAKHYGDALRSPAIYASMPFIKKYLEHLDPDTVVDIATGDDGQYQGFYIVPGPASRVASMLLPVISFDASHLKGLGDRNAEGKVYLAVSPDGARNLHVLSIGHSGNEATSSWQLFLKHVLKFRAAMKAEEDTSRFLFLLLLIFFTDGGGSSGNGWWWWQELKHFPVVLLARELCWEGRVYTNDAICMRT